MPKKLDHTKRKRTVPCAEQPVIYAHTCEIDKRTKIGTPAWNANNSAGAKRVDAIRSIHELEGSHEAAVARIASVTKNNVNQTLDTVQTRTIVRAVKEAQE